MTDIVERLRDRSDRTLADWARDVMEEAAKEIEQLKGGLLRANIATKVACANIITLNERVETIITALHSGLMLTDAMLTELRRLPGPPPIQVIIAKTNFDKTMKKLLNETAQSKEP